MFDKIFQHRKSVEEKLPKLPEQALALPPEMQPVFQYIPPVIMKTKKWVVHVNNNRVGIIADLSEYGFAEVHYVDANGCTNEVNKKCRVGELRIARWQEIPAPRRPASQTYAASLGYY